MKLERGARRTRHLKTEDDAGYRAPSGCRRLEDCQTECLFDLYYYLKYQCRDNSEKYRLLVDYATKDANFPGVMQRCFDEQDIDNNFILSEKEWPGFLQQLRKDVISSEKTRLPQLDEDVASNFYYVFNNISSDHAGISMAKLLKARQLYPTVEVEAEARWAANRKIRPKMQSLMLQLVLATVVIIAMLVHLGCRPGAIRDKLDALDGKVSEDLSRVVVAPRPDLEAKLQERGIYYGNDPAIEWSRCEVDAFWNERGKVDISQRAE